MRETGDKDRLRPTLSGDPLEEEYGEKIRLSSLDKDRNGDDDNCNPLHGAGEDLSKSHGFSFSFVFLGDGTKKYNKTYLLICFDNYYSYHNILQLLQIIDLANRSTSSKTLLSYEQLLIYIYLSGREERRIFFCFHFQLLQIVYDWVGCEPKTSAPTGS